MTFTIEEDIERKVQIDSSVWFAQCTVRLVLHRPFTCTLKRKSGHKQAPFGLPGTPGARRTLLRNQRKIGLFILVQPDHCLRSTMILKATRVIQVIRDPAALLPAPHYDKILSTNRREGDLCVCVRVLS